MNLFAAIFGIFRGRGLAKDIQERRSLAGFLVVGTVASALGGSLYGLATGIGLGTEAAIRDAIKVGLIALLGILFATPVFWTAYRLMGREEPAAQVAAVPLTMVATTSLILAVMSPVVFLLSVLIGLEREVVYVHVVIVDVALLVGVYLAGMLLSRAFSDHPRLIVPNVVSFVLFAVLLVVLAIFFGPYLTPHPTFSVGTDRLKDGLGIGVAERAEKALGGALVAERLTYRLQVTNENGDLVRDYTVDRAGEDYRLQVHFEALPEQAVRRERNVWLIDGRAFADFAGGRVDEVPPDALESTLAASAPSTVFALPPGFAAARWRASESEGRYTITAATPQGAQAILVIEVGSGRLSALTLGSVARVPHGELRLYDIQAGSLDRAGLQDSLRRARVLGSVDRSDASMEEYVQPEHFFVVRYPRNWRVGAWEPVRRSVEFRADCTDPVGCPLLTVSVYDLEEGKGAQDYAQDLAASLRLQPEYREVRLRGVTLGGQPAARVEYEHDRLDRGRIEASLHVEYILVGEVSRYHLDFAAPWGSFESYGPLFERVAGLFTYLGDSGEGG